MNYYVYMMASATNVTLYTGVTSDLVKRVYEHKNHLNKGSFTARYNIEKLVYYEVTSDVEAAIEYLREKGLAAVAKKASR